MHTVFVSHSTADDALAGAFVQLLLEAGIPSQGILCTSFSGYGLRQGGLVGDSLRRELRQSGCVIGLLTPASLDSVWVISELACAWGLGKKTYVVLCDTVEVQHIPKPLKDLVSTSAKNASDVVGLLTEVQSYAQIPSPAGPALLTAATGRFVSAHENSLPLAIGKVAAIAGKNEVFEAGVRAICAKSRQHVRIYAPTGVWHAHRWKGLWFDALAKVLANEQGVPTKPTGDSRIDGCENGLGDLTAAYGMPPPAGYGRSIGVCESEIDEAEQMLEPLHGIETAYLHYLGVDTSTIPGTGLIQVDDDLLFYCFAIHGQHSIDYAVAMRGSSDIHAQVSSWFERHVRWRLAHKKVLQDMNDNHKCLAKGFDEVRLQYGLQPKDKGCH